MSRLRVEEWALRHRPAIALAATPAATAAPLAFCWARGQTLAWFDMATFYAPVRSLVGEALRAFRLPLWNRFVAGGMPLLAETVHGVLHPLSVATAFLVPGDGVDPLIGAHVVGAGLGAAVLGRMLGAGWAASVACGVAYGLSGFTLSMAAHLVYLGGASGLPWMLAGLVGAARAAAPGSFALGVAATATLALAGDVQAVAVGGALAIPLAGSVAPACGVARAAGAALVGLCLAGIQLVPSWAFFTHSERAAGPSAVDLSQWSFSPWRAVELISPGFFIWAREGYAGAVARAFDPGSPTGLTFAASVYVGAPVLVAAAAGARASRAGRRLAAASVILLWMALGPRLGAQQLAAVLPVVSGFRYAEKYLGPLTLCLSLLAALGLERWLADRRRARRAAWSAGILGAVALLSLIGTFGSAAWATSPFDEAARDHLRLGLPHAVISLGVLAGAATLAARGRIGAARAVFLLLVWVEALAAAPYALRPGRPLERAGTPPPAVLTGARQPRVVHALPIVATGASGDFYDDVTAALSATAAVNLNVRYRVDDLDFYSGLRPRRFAAVRDAFGPAWARAARRFSVTHVLAQEPGSELERRVLAHAVEGGEVVGREPRTGALVFSVPHRPWASFPGRLEAVPDLAAAVRRLQEAEGADEGGAVVESARPLPVAPGRVLSMARGPSWLRIEADAEARATLVVNEAYWPGWRAEIDGAEVPILPADGLVRAVEWPGGRHVLQMRYVPPELRTGLLLSGAGLAALVGACLALRSRARRATAARP